MSTLPELIAARDAALLAWYAAGPASLSAEADAAWAAYKAASAIVARNITEGAGNPAPPPPPPDRAAVPQEHVVALAATAEAAFAHMQALETDPAASGDALWYAFDTAFLAAAAAYHARQPEQIAAKWAGVRRVLGGQS